MSYARRRVDANQAEIVEALRAAGCWVWHTHTVGGGFPDLLVCRFGRLYLLEVKSKAGTLTPDQIVWHREHPGAATVVRSIEEALAAVGIQTV